MLVITALVGLLLAAPAVAIFVYRRPPFKRVEEEMGKDRRTIRVGGPLCRGQRARSAKTFNGGAKCTISWQNWTGNRISMGHNEHPVQHYVGYRFPSRQNVPNDLAQFAH
jgi:hypothetical protein